MEKEEENDLDRDLVVWSHYRPLTMLYVACV